MPTRQSRSKPILFVKRIPPDVLGRTAGIKLDIPVGNALIPMLLTEKAKVVSLSLRTPHQAEALRREATILSYLDNVWAALRQAKPLSLGNRQLTAIAGELYRSWADGEGKERTLTLTRIGGTFIRDEVELEAEQQAFEAAATEMASLKEEALEPRLGPLADRLLLAKGIRALDEQCRPRLLQALQRAIQEAMWLRERQTGGDYSPDPAATRFPPFEPPKPAPSALPRLSITELFNRWWLDAQRLGRKAATHKAYEMGTRYFREFVGHDDALAVTPADVAAFKSAQLAKGLSPVSVKNRDLAALKVVFQFGVDNALILSNPASSIRLKAPPRQRLRGKGFTDAEAVALLHAASASTDSLRRWVPWLCAVTGARVGEITQLRKQDVQRDGSSYVLTISPEAGTQKSNQLRRVVLHKQVVELGFARWLDGTREQEGAHGYLFLRDASVAARNTATNQVRVAAREVLGSEDIGPNHGWRHRFKTVGLELGIPPRILDAIQGHSAKSASDGYGEVTLKAQAEAIAKFPRYAV